MLLPGWTMFLLKRQKKSMTKADVLATGKVFVVLSVKSWRLQIDYSS